MKLFLFDLDGTLCQTYYADDDSFVKAASKVIGVPFDKTSWRGCEHLTDSAIFEHFYVNTKDKKPEKHIIEEMQFQFIEILKNKHETNKSFFKEIPGATKFVNQIIDHPKSFVGVATGGWKHIAEFKLKNIGLNTNHLEFIGSDDHHSKVDFTEALIKKIRGKLKISSFDHTYYFGDSLYDKACCEILGIEFIGIDYKKDNRLNLSGVKRVYDHFDQIDLGDFL
jgi:phosphoglycolate phosphatase-like HAD superfamily hydrolase